MSFHLPDHALFLTVGPPRCGKSTFCHRLKTQLYEQLHVINPKVKINIVSSEQARRYLLADEDEELAKSDPAMKVVSKPAFEIMRLLLEKQMTYPVNANYLIVDSSGLSQNFRQEMFDLAKKYNYASYPIIFKFDHREDYYAHVDDGSAQQPWVDRLFRQVMPKIGSNYSKALIVPGYNHTEILADWKLNLKPHKYRAAAQLDPSKRYLTIGDIHCCAKDLYALLIKAGFAIVEGIVTQTEKTANCEVILLGDLIDKGADPAEILIFVDQNLQHPKNLIHLVYGNHEDTSFRLLTGATKESQYSEVYYTKYYNSYRLIRDNPELKEIFLRVCEKAMDFFEYWPTTESNGYPFIASHAPCSLDVLGKTSPRCRKQQRDQHLDRDKPIIPQILKHCRPDTASFPLHLCGHISCKQPYLGPFDDRGRNNLVCLDTGAVYGGYLTGLWVGQGMGQIRSRHLVRVKSGYPPVEGKPLLELSRDEVTPEVAQERFLALEPRQQRRIKGLCQRQISFLPGTISPPAQNRETGELESVRSALTYYRNQMERRKEFIPLVIEPKYMGSRGNMYLYFDQPDKNQLISRNAYSMGKLTLEVKEGLYLEMTKRLAPLVEEYGIKEIIIDLELMPWSGIGQGLIDSQFRSVSTALEAETAVLAETGFDEALARLREMDAESKKKPSATVRAIRKTKGVFVPSVDQQRMAAEFKEQVEWYGKEEEIHVKGFSILRFVLNNGEVVIPGVDGFQDHPLAVDQAQLFKMLNDDEIMIIELEKKFEETVTHASGFFESLRGKKMEGVVIKPLYLLPDCAPMLKVRNPEYLKIIYGWDYQLPEKMSLLMKKKSVWKKMRTSKDEFALGIQMLQRTGSELSIENPGHLTDLMDFLRLEESEASFDPAL